MNDLPQRWRYTDQKGRKMWIAFDPNFLCVNCDKPVEGLTTSGPLFCASCAIGTIALDREHARKRIEEIPNDPEWARYQWAYIAKCRGKGVKPW